VTASTRDPWVNLLRPETASDEGALLRLYHALKRRVVREKPLRVLAWDNGEEYSDWSILFIDIQDFAVEDVERLLRSLDAAYRSASSDKKGFVVAVFEVAKEDWKRGAPRSLVDLVEPHQLDDNWDFVEDKTPFIEACVPFADYLLATWSNYHFEMRTLMRPLNYGDTVMQELGFLDLVMEGATMHSRRHNFPVAQRAIMEAEVREDWDAAVAYARDLLTKAKEKRDGAGERGGTDPQDRP